MGVFSIGTYRVLASVIGMGMGGQGGSLALMQAINKNEGRIIT